MLRVITSEILLAILAIVFTVAWTIHPTAEMMSIIFATLTGLTAIMRSAPDGSIPRSSNSDSTIIPVDRGRSEVDHGDSGKDSTK